MRILLLIGVVAYYATSFNAVIADSDFASNFFKAVAEDASGNMISSSISVEALLSLMSFGARGNTRKQMISALEPNNNDSSVQPAINFLNKVDGFDQANFLMANGVFLADGYSMNPNFVYMMMMYQINEVTNMNFANPTAASKIINDWSAANTNNLIRELISPESLSAETSVVLVNAIYFKGNWTTPFAAEDTTPRPFSVNGVPKDVPTMRAVEKFRYGKIPEIKASYVELPYLSDDPSHDISMYVILPDEVDGFEQLKNNLDKITVDKLIKNAENRMVNLYLPKFKIESSMRLDAPLVKMGLTDMFSDAADFSGIVKNGKPNKVQMIQKAFIEVNEEGTEAAAATGGILDNRFGNEDDERLPLVKFEVNRPFVSIVGTKSGQALFSAITVDPQSE